MENGTQIAGTWYHKDWEKAHPAGWVIEYQPAVSDVGWIRWYADLNSAKHDLAQIAASANRELSRDGRYLDVTPIDWEGCAESRYFIRQTYGRDKDWVQE